MIGLDGGRKKGQIYQKNEKNLPIGLHLPWVSDNITISGLARSPIAINLTIECKRSETAFEEWQINTYKAIMDSYLNMKSEYESAMAAAQIQAGIKITGNNPEINRKIEREELQKWCTEALLLDRFEEWNAMKKAVTGEPEIDFNQVKKETSIVSFMNVAFDWENMTYKPYPYFYGNKAEHSEIRELTDTEPKFMDMLRAGYARIILPVQYGFTSDLFYIFLQQDKYGMAMISYNRETFVPIHR
ncbi:MAG: hypothetical protein IPH04_11770 [Saprospirales bacterium]|nr:hypothetical protein [Saprospirales bacterium]